MNLNNKEIIQLLKKLTDVPAVSGCESDFAHLLSDMLTPFGKAKIDSMNNVSCTFGEGTHFLLDAHIDQIGMIVKAVTDDGFIKLDKCGGIDNRMLTASEVSIWGKKEVRGVISSLPPHLQSKDDKKNVASLDDLAVDVGMTKEEAEQLISLGDRATFKRVFTPLMNNQICSNSLDNRAGVCAVLLALEKLKGVNAKITVLFTSQEEVGLRGAKTGSFIDGVDEAICVDVSFAYTPFCKKSECGEIGKGAMIGFSPILSNNMSRAMKNVAIKKGIAFQEEIMGGGHTGTDADVISVSRCGIKTSLLSIPQKYMHSPVEVVNVDDIDSTACLIAEYIKQRVGDDNA